MGTVPRMQLTFYVVVLEAALTATLPAILTHYTSGERYLYYWYLAGRLVLLRVILFFRQLKFSPTTRAAQVSHNSDQSDHYRRVGL